MAQNKIRFLIILIFLPFFHKLAAEEVSTHYWREEDDIRDKLSEESEIKEKIVDITKKKNYVEFDSFYDPKVDYSIFKGRVSDRDSSGNIFKVHSENLNVKFLKSGDYLLFKIGENPDKDFCGAYVRGVEVDYFTVFIKDIYPCWKKDDYFKRGTILDFKAEILAKRVRDASLYRVVLVKRRQDFLKQLNDINHFLWSYDQQKVITASEYDKQIEEIRREKQKALEGLITRKKDQINLQKELMYRLDVLDRDTDFYRVEKKDTGLDRWASDGDLGLPVGERPQTLKPKVENNHRANF